MLKRLLLADDHAITRHGIKRLLETEFPGVNVTEAVDADDLLCKSPEEEFDCILTDIDMPGQDVFNVIAVIKNNSPRLPILVLSLHQEGLYAIHAIRAGASGFLNKAAGLDQLVAAVSTICQGKKYITSSLAEKLVVAVCNKAGNSPGQALSDRELIVMKYIAEGRSLTEIADKLSIVTSTVSTYRNRILKKMNMHSNSDIVRYTIANQLL